jgi:hypothetical protein
MHRTFLLLIPLVICSCVKEPGIGGRGEIHGLVLEQRYDDGAPVGEPYPIPEQDVFIVYGDGDGETSDDDVSTGADGRFRFPWLRKGSYRIFVISECDTAICPSGNYSVVRSVELEDRRDLVDAGVFVIENH